MSGNKFTINDRASSSEMLGGINPMRETMESWHSF